MPQKFDIPINYHLNQGQPSVFSDSALVQFQEGAFTVSFFQVVQPMIGPETDPATIKAVDAFSVARVALPARVFEQLLGIMTENLRKYRETFGEPEPPPRGLSS